MKDFLKKQWSIPILIIGLMSLVFLLNIIIFSITLSSPYDENIWRLSEDIPTSEIINIFAFMLKLIFWGSLVLIIYSGLSTLAKQENKAIISSIIYIIAFETLLILFQIIFQGLTGFQVFLTLFNIVIAVGMGFLYVYKEKLFGENNNSKNKELEKKLVLTKIPLAVLIIDAISMVVLLLIFLIPLYSLEIAGEKYLMVMANVIFSGETNLGVIISFFIN
ncbi:MAG: hypothetical protein PHT83_04735, partial [Bacilli bacterium]|nr:hypothetical protein [Bacilli bacterium]